jgi:hypothetical protein
MTEKPRLNILLSFAYGARSVLKNITEWHKATKGICHLSLFLDSGAFAALRGVHIDVNDYADFLDEHKQEFKVYANLDVIGDADKSARNLKILEGRGHTPLPCWHVGSSEKILEAMAEKYEYFAIGGMARKSKTELLYRLPVVFERAKGRKLHGFGFTKFDLLKVFPFYSVDSSSWMMGRRSGAAPLVNPRSLRTVCVNWGYKHSTRGEGLVKELRKRELIKPIIVACGFSPYIGSRLLLETFEKNKRLIDWFSARSLVLAQRQNKLFSKARVYLVDDDGAARFSPRGMLNVPAMIKWCFSPEGTKMPKIIKND